MKLAALLPLLLSSSAALAAAGPGECELTVEGAVQISGKAQGRKNAVGTDHWNTKEELRKTVRAMLAATQKLSDAELDAATDKRMKAEPRITALALTCEVPGARLSFIASKETRYKTMPMKAGAYPVARGMRAAAGEVGALLMLKDNAFMAEGGKLRIAEWNRKHIAGTFDVELVDREKRKVTVKGSFDFPCRASSSCQK
jgi:hypothetical protein